MAVGEAQACPSFSRESFSRGGTLRCELLPLDEAETHVDFVILIAKNSTSAKEGNLATASVTSLMLKQGWQHI